MPQRRAKYLFAFVLLLAVHPLCSATVTYVVGTCKPAKGSFITISAALAATPAPDQVQVCPGTYSEQIVITQPVTLQGISSGNEGQILITAPAGGFTANATSAFLGSLEAQIWVNNVAGAVTISDITVDGTQTPNSITLAGIFYANSPGTVNRVTVRNQMAEGFGMGILLEGGSANPTVTVQNSTLHDFDQAGVETDSVTPTSGLTAVITNNFVDGNVPASRGGVFPVGIELGFGSTNTVAGNRVTRANTGIIAFQAGNDIPAAAGTISNNIVINNSTGIQLQTDDVSLTNNKIYLGQTGIFLAGETSPTVQGNAIYESTNGIDFGCGADPNVQSNTIEDATVGVDDVPDGIATTNVYLNTATIRQSCGAKSSRK